MKKYIPQNLFDIHCHFVPDVDDGSDSLEESLWLLRKDYAEGVNHIILTPHFRYEMFEPSMEHVQKQFLLLKDAAAKYFGSNLHLYLGCELHASMDMEQKLASGERLTLAGSDYVLAEFSTSDPKSYLRERTQKLLNVGYVPILAHIERYECMYDNFDFIQELRSMGAKIQVNADSVIGKDGFSMKRFTKKLMKQDLLDFIGSDGHHQATRIPEIGKAAQTTAKWMGEDYADRIFIYNPMQILSSAKRKKAAADHSVKSSK